MLPHNDISRTLSPKAQHVITLYRADPRSGLDAIDGITSWTTDRAHASRYASGQFTGFGGPHLYFAEVEASNLLDLRRHSDYTKIRQALLDLGIIDLDDYDYLRFGYFHDLVREITSVVQAHGYHWLAFCDERPLSEVDEWLYLGSIPIPVHEL